MDKIRDTFGRFFSKNSDQAPGQHTAEAIEEELKRKDVIDLMQQQRHQDHKQDDEQNKKHKSQDGKKPPTLKPKDDMLKDDVKASQANIYEIATTNLSEQHEFASSDTSQQATIDYEMEFVDFINRNTPPGFGIKLQKMMPYLGASFVAWPSYWMWRGFNWQTRRRTERIGMYIQRVGMTT